MIEDPDPDPNPDPYLWLKDPDPEAQKHVDPVDPDPQHWFWGTVYNKKPLELIISWAHLTSLSWLAPTRDLASGYPASESGKVTSVVKTNTVHFTTPKTLVTYVQPGKLLKVSEH